MPGHRRKMLDRAIQSVRACCLRVEGPCEDLDDDSNIGTTRRLGSG